MPYRNRRPTYGNFILVFAGIKVLLNLLAVNHFGFHRDELLHLSLGDHLAWGYKEVPPFIAFLATIINNILGDSLFATRIFPTISAALLVWFTGKLTVELGGRRMAITLACLTVIFAPAFAASNYLFQPVVFDQLWWLLAVYLLVRYINSKNAINLYFLGVIVGVGLLTKYTMAFFAISLIFGLLLGRQHKVLLNRHALISAIIALIIFSPNGIWQFTHHLPIVTHMNTLRANQLEHNDAEGFILQQFLVNGMGLFVWMTGLLCLFISYRLRKYMFMGIAYLLVFAFLLKMNGKNYYLFPAYPMLFAAGSFMIESWIRKMRFGLRVAMLTILVLPNLLLLPMVLPFFSLQTTQQYIQTVVTHLPGLNFAITWEDQKKHSLTQDYADMLGWEEMVAKTAKVYNALSAEEKKETVIMAGNYGEAGAFQHYGPVYGLPQIISLDSSFSLWAPATINAQHIIYVCDDEISELAPLAGNVKLIESVKDVRAREYGTSIYLIKDIKPSMKDLYEQTLTERLLK